MNRIAVAFLATILAAGTALASQQGSVAEKKWKAMDVCTRQAQAAYPDFTTEANAKRDAKLKECLAGQNLPPRESLAPGRCGRGGAAADSAAPRRRTAIDPAGAAAAACPEPAGSDRQPPLPVASRYAA